MSDIFENIRKCYRPDNVNVLFVGESPPNQGTFFYCANSNLYRYTLETFESVFPQCGTAEAFLRFFKSKGCHLDDLCQTAINTMTLSDKKKYREAGVAPLASRMQQYQPTAIISVMKAIEPYVIQAMIQAGLQEVAFYSLPFPACGNQRRYVNQLIPVLRELFPLYFAYGSNMDPEQMRCRIGRFDESRRRRGILENLRLAFNKISKDGTGKANVMSASQDDYIEGIIYEINRRQLCCLDNDEKGYCRVEMSVKSQDRVETCWVYVSSKIDNMLKPKRCYLEKILKGKPFLSEAYYRRLENIDCI